MTMRMLIDARHREETRVAVVKGNRIEEFDFESAERKQLKGNIYLAKVTRVEPSLQAAFVDYGGNRHGFLAFSEIHPDYYQIPKEDREALLREEAEHAAEEAALRAEEDGDEDHEDGDVEVLERPVDDEDHHDDHGDHDHDESEEGEESAEGESNDGGDRRRGRGGKARKESPADALRNKRMNLRRRYKIQDVIRRRQVLLVQVVKEERGNKGAALTTYLSLAGRYCVLMPNTAHGGGISRKISSAADRKRLKSIMTDLKLPPTMGCIVRTAGLQRTKVEIKRDFDYLARLWDGIREEVLKSSAPALVYGDSDLMKRAIRDIYNKDIDEVIVEGEDGYRQAKEFMKLLMPSHARRVKHYADSVPLFQRAGVEEQLSAMYNPVVQLKSGGYLVINPTEALVSIDINSGRSTREHSIEQTATQTNLEAAAEIARQLRLRDMAGLVVIDFIDMDHGSNVRKVEKAMKEALKNDRARIQVGRISAFGLMEMSRQRLRTGVLEASTRQCPHCEGTGLVRTASSAGLSALRMIEDEAARGRGSQLLLRASQEAAFYVLNRKRFELAEIEERYGVIIEVTPDGEMEGARMAVEAHGPPPTRAPRPVTLIEEPEDDYVEEVDEEEIEEEAAEEERPRRGRDRAEREPRADSEAEGEGRGKRRRRRRGRRGRTNEDGSPRAEGDEGDEGEGEEGVEGEAVEGGAPATEGERSEESVEGARKRRRRGRRGGRRGGTPAENAAADAAEDAADAAQDAEPVNDVAEMAEAEPEAAPAPKRSRGRKKAVSEVEGAESEAAVEARAVVEAEPVAEAAPAKRSRSRKKPALSEVEGAEAEAVVEAPAVVESAPEPEPVAEAPAPKRARGRKKAEVEAAPAVDAEPIEQDLVPGGGDAASAEAEAEAGEGAGAGEAGPRRGGWWQRTFGA